MALPHSSSAQYAATRRIAISGLQPGDLVFYYSPISHVAVYVGDGKIVDAPYPRAQRADRRPALNAAGAGRP